MNNSEKPKLHIAMFPWIGMGHIITYATLSNDLANRGHTISFLLPNKGLLKLQNQNIYSNLIKFYTVAVPHVPGLPLGAETTADIDYSAKDPLAIAFDAMSDQVEELLSLLKPDIVLFDFAHWITNLAAKIGFKTVCYSTVSASCMAIGVVPARHFPKDRQMTDEELAEPPRGYPSKTVVFRRHEARALSFICSTYGDITFDARISSALRDCDAIGTRTVGELEGPMCDYLAGQYKKPVFLSGPVLPQAPKTVLEDKWDKWLSKFKPKSVLYCAFGSQNTMRKEQFQELVLGFEMTGMPFFLALSKPHGANSIEEALPEGFLDRVGDMGVVHDGWVQQTQILNHPSVGCFVSHCGFGSSWESLLSDAQIVVVPWLGDQILNARLLSEEMKVAVEVERGENAWFSKEDLCIAIKSLIDPDSQLGKTIQQNHLRWKETLSKPGFYDHYIDNFIENLHQLI
ncbi:anthocyanidin 3-O-glucoside 2'''-O-xylosyltransferase-like [Henckelia pumila]|uniref:anthocyanidin 3-O-glucoside 2'''-O-xylosyltransferase-like n=1 Tax=Henckelia pumila TaxID=405737 RepID=UPI003C6DF08D